MELNPAPPRHPASIGKYEVVRHLAAGGMAEVFLARTSGMLGFQKSVVIKRILPHLANRADFIQMFLDEARITTQLQHPNIVQTYEVGVADHSYFIAMEYLHGETVRSIMSALAQKNERLPIEHAVHVISAIAAGLHYAHERADTDGKPLSIVHRDVTPQNIIVTFDGTVKLLDFGIAKAHNRMGETRAGTLKGKLPYMSPEQCGGEEMDQRSDIFSLGIMLYELTLTRRLFRGVSDFQILKQIVEGEVTPPREIDPSYPPALEEIVLRALRKPRDERYQSARELLVDLEAFRRTERLPTSSIALADFVGSLFPHGSEAPGPALTAVPSAAERSEGIGHAHTGLSLEIEISAGDSQRTPQRSSGDFLDGPDIPPTPPFHLEFTSTGTLSPAAAHPLRSGSVAGSVADSASAPVTASASAPRSSAGPARGPLARVAIALSLIGAGVGLALVARLALPATPSPVPVATRTPEAAVPPAIVAPAPVPQPPSVVPAIEPALPAGPRGVARPLKQPGRSHREPARGNHQAASTLPTTRTTQKLEGEGTLVLATTPWCEVTIDNLARGTTPLTTRLPAGPHTILLTNGEFHVRRSVTVHIVPDQTLRKRLDFDTP